MSIDLTWLSVVMIAASAYYFGLATLAWLQRRKVDRSTPNSLSGTSPFVVVVIPAHNEELVIERTLRALHDQEWDDLLVLVMNDGSTDRTHDVAASVVGRAEVLVVDRGQEIAGRGKGAVLNDALARINNLVNSGSSLLRGRQAGEIVVGVMDADGLLESSAIGRVLPFFDDPNVGGVQVGVRIANAGDGLLARMQDMEFVGFSGLVQEARDCLGSVGLGGNGQFVRLSALNSVGLSPWTTCLTEDLDLSLTLVENGWRIRFCGQTSVAQQGLTRMLPLLRQRTRWIQGHYQCWSHIPGLWSTKDLKLRTKVDLSIYLLMVPFVILVALSPLLSVAALTGRIVVDNHLLEGLPSGPIRNLLIALVAAGPLLVFVYVYQRNAGERLRFYEVPLFALLFGLYAYLFIASQVRAWTRFVLRRDGWAKTARLAPGSAG